MSATIRSINRPENSFKINYITLRTEKGSRYNIQPIMIGLVIYEDLFDCGITGMITIRDENDIISGAGVKSAILEIPGNEWGHAITLPYANWVSGNGPDRRMGPFSNGMLKETVSAARKMTEKAAQGIKP